LEIFISKGDKCLFRGEYDLAIAQYQKAAELEPDNPAIHFQLGTAYAKSKAFKKAIDEFKSTLEWMPFFYPAIYNLAMCYKQVGEDRKAKSLMEYLSALAQDAEGAITPDMIDASEETGVKDIVSDHTAVD